MDKVLTIIVPSYNMEKYLPKCLGSLVCDLPCRGGEGVEERREERLGEGEGKGGWLELLDVIVVNDGSKDRTSEIAHEFEAKYPGVFRVIDKENGHYGSCVNAALPLAKGRYVRLLDADDSFDTASLRVYIEGILKAEGERPDAIVNDTVWINEAGERKKLHEFPYMKEGMQTFDSLPEGICRDFMLQAPFAFRTELLREMKYRQTEGMPYTDAEWATLPFAKVKTLLYVKVPLYLYLVGREGQSMNLEVMKRHFWMSAQTAVDCLKQLVDLGPSVGAANQQYVLQRAEMMLLSSYMMAIFAVHSQESDQVMSRIDLDVQRLSPVLYERTAARGVAVKGFFPYVKIWRWHHSSNHPLLRAFRLLQKIFL